MKRLLLGLLGLAALVGASAPTFAQCPGVNCTISSTIAVPMASATYGAQARSLVVTDTATDIFGICGSASKTINVTRIGVSGRATAAVNGDVLVARRSSANSGGTSTTPTPVAYDTTTSAATAVARAYTDNPTVGTLIGYISSAQLALGNLTTTLGFPLIFDFSGNSPAANVVLRGTSQCIYLNLASSTYSGNTLDAFVEWTEQ